MSLATALSSASYQGCSEKLITSIVDGFSKEVEGIICGDPERME
jgi:hypothetical protein